MFVGVTGSDSSVNCSAWSPKGRSGEKSRNALIVFALAMDDDTGKYIECNCGAKGENPFLPWQWVQEKSCKHEII